MITYDFDRLFWDAITAGTKSGTIRRIRTKPQRHARPGEPIELWTTVDHGQRLQIAKKECLQVQGVVFEGTANRICLGDITKNRSTWPALDLGAREGLARLTGHRDWAHAHACYEARYGAAKVTLCLVTWRDREYAGPIPSAPQMRDLKVLACHKALIPSYGKISVQVGHALLILRWAEVVNPDEDYWGREKRGEVAIRITDLGRWILERFDR